MADSLRIRHMFLFQTGHGGQNIDLHALNAAFHRKRFIDIYIKEFTTACADYTIGFALQEQLDSQITHFCGIDTVAAIGCAATLDMTKNRNPGIQINCFLDLC